MRRASLNTSESSRIDLLNLTERHALAAILDMLVRSNRAERPANALNEFEKP